MSAVEKALVIAQCLAVAGLVILVIQRMAKSIKATWFVWKYIKNLYPEYFGSRYGKLKAEVEANENKVNAFLTMVKEHSTES